MTDQSLLEERIRPKYQNKRVDYLTVRLRRMVKSLIKQEMEPKQNPSSTVLKRKDQHVLITAVWFLIYGICLVLFGYQMYDRVSYYLTYPVAVDVFEIKKSIQTFPEITVCNNEVDELFQLVAKYNAPCTYGVILHLLNKEIPHNTYEIWKHMRAATTLISAEDVLGSQSIPLQFTEVPLHQGTCATFRSKNSTDEEDKELDRFFEITFKRSSHRCASNSYKQVYVHEPGDLPTFHQVFYFLGGGNGAIVMTKRKFFFVNRPGNPCISSDDQRTCLENCFVEFIRKSRADKCRFPFYPPKFNESISYCNASNNTAKLWKHVETYFDGHSKTDCRCARKCEHTSLAERPTSTKSNQNTSTIILRYDSFSETVIKERLCYDFIQLLCDIGGNSGLWIGCSLLSLFQLAHLAFKCEKKQKSQFAETDPLYRIVVKTFSDFKQYNHNRIQKSHTKEISRKVLILKMVVLCLSISLLLMTTVNRLIYFLQYPLTTVLDISFNSTLATPIAILCPGNPNIIKLQQETANLPNYYSVDVWDLLDWPGINLSYLWINPTLENTPIISFYSKRIPFYDGECLDLNQGIPTVSPNTKKFFVFNYTALLRSEDYMVYLTTTSGNIEYTQYAYIAQFRLQQIDFSVKEIQTDKLDIPCVNTEENEQCINRCLNKILISRINCRLPYMLEADLPDCHSSSSARRSHQTFRNLFFVPASKDECNCMPQCRKRFLEIRHFIEDSEITWTSLGVGPKENVVEVFMIQPSYSVVKLLCDVGGMMGSTLGLSILSIMETVLILLGKAFKQPKNVTH